MMKINKKGNKGQLRQGDLLFVKLGQEWSGDQRQGDLKPSRDGIVAKGEVTGHNHELAVDTDKGNLAQLFFSESGIPVVVVEKGEVDIVHPEHSTQTLDEGTWIVVRQVEYTPQERWRTVAD